MFVRVYIHVYFCRLYLLWLYQEDMQWQLIVLSIWIAEKIFPSLEDIQQESTEGDTKDSNLCVHSPALRTSKERNVPPDKSQQFGKIFPFKTWKMGTKLQN